MQPLGLPTWLVAGLALGTAFSMVAALLFLAGTHMFPEPETDRGRRVADDERRREEIRGYLRYIGESFAEDHPVAGQTVAFYLPRRDVAITFDARAYFRLDGSGTYAVLVEHELPGAALGARLPFETPTPTPGAAGRGRGPGPGRGPADAAGRGSAPGDVAGRGSTPGDAAGRGRTAGDAALAGPSEDPSSAAFATLGLPTTADVETVRAAYREQVKAVHPDQGGDPEEFQRLREAYAVAREAAS